MFLPKTFSCRYMYKAVCTTFVQLVCYPKYLHTLALFEWDFEIQVESRRITVLLLYCTIAENCEIIQVVSVACYVKGLSCEFVLKQYVLCMYVGLSKISALTFLNLKRDNIQPLKSLRIILFCSSQVRTDGFYGVLNSTKCKFNYI